ncbi:MAG: ExbD/TolR family protein [Verrucomicrobiales bacterium]
MKIQRRPLLVEPPSSAATDIAFILMIFFLVCASVQPGTGREQTIPRSEEDEENSQQNKHIEISIAPGAVVVDGEPIPTHRLSRKLRGLLAGKDAEEDRVVIVKSSPRTQYQHWVNVTSMIEEAGGIITLQLEEAQTISVD